MSQVRKDILNGWKEIGGYVSRDIRTVERWEKQRGLPVRRVPGAGRATVYALISELDEWLASSKQEEKELPSDSVVVTFVSSPQFPAQLDASEASITPESSFETVSAAGLPVVAEEIQPSHALREPHIHGLLRRRGLIAGVVSAVAASLVCVLAWPLVRGYSKAADAQTSAHPQSNELGKNPGVPYRSQVPGVDDLYLRGVYSFEQRTPESLRRSLDDFSGAIQKDPNYAPAYAGLANTYNLLREYSVMPDPEAYPKAKAAAERAIALDPNLPQAHASLGFIDFFWSWDTVAAEREFRTALALDPTSVIAHHWYGSMLTHEARYKEAIEQLDIAQRLQPTSVAILSTRALALGLSGQRGEAVDLLQDVLNQTPSASSPHAILAILSKVQPHEPATFLQEMRRASELRHSEEMLKVMDAAEPAYRSGGEAAMWAAILATEERLHPGASNTTYLMAQSEAALGRDDAAFADLTQLLKRRSSDLIGIPMDPAFLPLHQDPRFAQLVASMGLPAVPR